MTKLCPRGKAAAKRKFAVYPSAYANAYASKICAGKIKDPSGKKRKDFKGPKPAAMGAMINKPKKAAIGAIIGLGAAALGKKMLGRKTKKAMPTKGIGPITTMAEKQAKKRKEFMGMSKGGGADTGTRGEIRSKRNVALDKLIGPSKRGRATDMKVYRRELYKSTAGKKIPAIMGGGMMKRFNKGGGADTGTVGEMKSKFGVTLNKARRFARKIRDTDRLTESDIRKAKDMLKSPKEKALNITKRSIDILKSSKKQGGMMKYNKGGMADYYKDLM